MLGFTQAKRPPGPLRIPFLGSGIELGRDPLTLLSNLGRNYGPISYTTLGLARVNLLNEPELIEEALLGRHRECTKDVGTQELVPLVGRGLLTSEGELWKRQRRLASPPLSPKRIAGYAETMVECTERACAGFADGEERDIHRDMMALTLEIVGKTLLGFDASGDAERVAHVLDVAMVYFNYQLHTLRVLIPKWIVTKDRRDFRKVVAELDAIVYRIIEHCRSSTTEQEHLLARLVAARDENGQAMSDVQLRDEAVTMLLAGHETTALALSFAVYLLSEHPEADKRLRQELEANVGNRRLTLDDLAGLPYLDAVVRETLRLYPPAWVVGREVAEPFELGGFTMQKGDQLLMSPYAMQREPRFFREPERFLPERWLDGLADRLPRFAYFPFGGGPRVCIGNHFATMEAKLVLGALVQRVELSVVPGFPLVVEPIVTLRPKHGVRVKIRRRTGTDEAAA